MRNYVLNSVEDVVLVTMNHVPNTPSAIARIFQEIGDQRINVDMICQTAPYKEKINLSFTIDQSDLTNVLVVTAALKQKFPDLITEASGGNTKITIFSELLKTESGVAARLFHNLEQHDVQVKLITTSDVEISILIDANGTEDVLVALFREFDE